jgi:protein-L-isoaspartate(D-aspartate) O-methyltransferase
MTPATLVRMIRETPGVEPAVADAMAATPRHRYVRWRYLLRAYTNRALPTGPGTTISQPTYIARVLSAGRVARTDRVLEIGAGSGWTAAILGRLAAEVITVERMPELARAARQRLAAAANVRVVEGETLELVDGTFDAIFVMAGAPEVPAVYTDRLREGGRLIIPIGRLRDRARGCMKGYVTRVTRAASTLSEEELFAGDWNLLHGAGGYRD